MMNLFEPVNGPIAPGKLTLFSPVRNEMFFLPAFLAHYRKLGVEQFCFIDDNSTDGSSEYIAKQADCIIIRSRYGFGDRIRSETVFADEKKRDRAGIIWKREFPLQYLAGQWAVYLDLDEFLLLPPGFDTLHSLIKRLEKTRSHSAPAVMIDFYPERPADLAENVVVNTFEDLAARYSFFDGLPHVDWSERELEPRVIYHGAITRLFQSHGIMKQRSGARWLPAPLKKLFPRRPLTAGNLSKIPLVRWTNGVRYHGSHRLSVPPNTDVLLPIAHFKLTHDLLRKIDDALTTRAYAAGSSRYSGLKQLLDTITRSGGSFLGPHSRRYVGSEAFTECGIAKCDL